MKCSTKRYQIGLVLFSALLLAPSAGADSIAELSPSGEQGVSVGTSELVAWFPDERQEASTRCAACLARFRNFNVERHCTDAEARRILDCHRDCHTARRPNDAMTFSNRAGDCVRHLIAQLPAGRIRDAAQLIYDGAGLLFNGAQRVVRGLEALLDYLERRRQNTSIERTDELQEASAGSSGKQRPRRYSPKPMIDSRISRSRSFGAR